MRGRKYKPFFMGLDNFFSFEQPATQFGQGSGFLFINPELHAFVRLMTMRFTFRITQKTGYFPFSSYTFLTPLNLTAPCGFDIINLPSGK
jgi:hypothetical protein